MAAAGPVPLPVGIIGIGRHGSRYARHLARGEVPGLRLAAVSRRSATGARQAEGWNCVFHRHWQDLVADHRVAAVIAATTPNLHPEIATACRAAGKPLLVEKPLAVDGAAARRLLAAAGDLPLTVGHTLRFNPVMAGLRRHLPEIGTLYHFHAGQRLEPTVHDWLDDPAVAGGGVILHTAVHVFDGLFWITGRRIVRVRALSGCRHTRRLEDLFLGLVELEGGVVGTVDASKVGAGRSGRYEFVGADGQLHGDQVLHRLERIRGTTVTPLVAGDPAPTIVGLLTAWHRFLAGKGDNPVEPAAGLAAVLVADACRTAAALSRDTWVAVAPA